MQQNSSKSECVRTISAQYSSDVTNTQNKAGKGDKVNCSIGWISTIDVMTNLFNIQTKFSSTKDRSVNSSICF